MALLTEPRHTTVRRREGAAAAMPQSGSNSVGAFQVSTDGRFCVSAEERKPGAVQRYRGVFQANSLQWSTGDRRCQRGDLAGSDWRFAGKPQRADDRLRSRLQAMYARNLRRLREVTHRCFLKLTQASVAESRRAGHTPPDGNSRGLTGIAIRKSARRGFVNPTPSDTT